jgi:restriction system protein
MYGWGLKRTRQRRSDALTRVGWDRMESLLAAYYRDQGYTVTHCGTGATGKGTDGGIDLKLHRDDQYIVVQCKHWNAYQVPHNDVHQLLGVMVNEGATGAILVTSGEFTNAARRAADKLGHVQLIDGDQLREMLGPLPEPAPSVFDTIELSVPRTMRDAGSRIASHAGERLLQAAEDRIRYGGRSKANTVARSFTTFLIMKVVVVLLFLLVVWFLFRTLTLGLAAALAPHTSSPPIPPALAAPQTQGSPVLQPRPVPRTGSNSDACREVIDARSGTYIDHCAQASTAKPTVAEQRELQRRADEAAKVIAPSTPEM